MMSSLMQEKQGYKETAIGRIPEDWEVKTLSKIAKITMGQSPDSNYCNDTGNGIPFFQGNADFGSKYPVTRYWTTQPTKKAFTNDVLMSVRAPVGALNYSNLECCIGRGLCAIKAIKTTKEFIYYSLKHNMNRFNQLAQGSTFEAVNKADVYNFKIPTPPTQEQQKIAEILSCVDDSIEKTDEIIKQAEELKKGLMQELFTKGLGHTDFQETKIGTIPKDWEIKQFKDVSKVNQGLQIAISERHKEKKANRHIYITIQYLNTLKNPEYVENPLSSVMCNKDDVLMTRTGNTGIVITNVEGVFHNNFFKIDFDRGILNKDFLVYYLRRPKLKDLLLAYAGSTTIPDLNHGDFYAIPVVLPKIEEQQKIAEILSGVDKKIETERNYKTELEELKKGIMQDLLTGKRRVKV